MGYRIYVDEAGTHGEDWLIIGMLFVPNHAPIHNALCAAKDTHKYFNTSPKISAKYKETHLAHFKSARDVKVAESWIDVFMAHNCFYRCVVVDWNVWQGRYFGNPFESDALKKRRAYKKWAEMLLQPEVSSGQIKNAELYLDRLRMVQSYDVLDHLEQRFTRDYVGNTPYIRKFQHTDSVHDANQCLQLCDLLTGCQYQALVPAQRLEKLAPKTYLEQKLQPLKVTSLKATFWKQFAPHTLSSHMPKFSSWMWKPAE